MPPKKRLRVTTGKPPRKKSGADEHDEDAEMVAMLKAFNSGSEDYSSSDDDANDKNWDEMDLFRPDLKPKQPDGTPAPPVPAASIFTAKATDVNLAALPATHRPPTATSAADTAAVVHERQVTLQSLNYLSHLKQGVVLFYVLDGRDLPPRYGQSLLFAKAYHLQRRRWLSVGLRVEGLRREVYIVPSEPLRNDWKGIVTAGTGAAGDPAAQAVGATPTDGPNGATGPLGLVGATGVISDAERAAIAAHNMGIQARVMLELAPHMRRVGIDISTVRSEVVRRWYAFEEAGMSRSAQSVIKITWPSTAPALGIGDAADPSGKGVLVDYVVAHGDANGAKPSRRLRLPSIAKVFGDAKSPLETLLLKQRIRGPTWVAIATPALHVITAPQDKLTWCTAEIVVRTPPVKGVGGDDLVRMAAHAGVELTETEVRTKHVPGYRFVRAVAGRELAASSMETVTLSTVSLALIVAEGDSGSGAAAGGRGVGKAQPASSAASAHGVGSGSSQIYGAVLLITHGVPTDSAPTRTTTSEEFIFVRPVDDPAINPRRLLPPTHTIVAAADAGRIVRPRECRNESDLLNSLMLKLMEVDPDVVVGHNYLGYDLDLLLQRCEALKVPNWSVLGRMQWRQFPRRGRGGPGFAAGPGGGGGGAVEKQVMSGRLVADTYVLSQEHLHEPSYRLWALAASQRLTGPDGRVMTTASAPKDYTANETLRAMCDAGDMVSRLVIARTKAWLSLALCNHLQAIPLTKQLTNLAGNLWSRTLSGSRAERIEYYLMHRFYAAKFILPAKYANTTASLAAPGAPGAPEGDGDGEDEDGKAVRPDAGGGRKREKAKYKGGMVLEPKRGLYTTWVLLLDFNSLYPSIIQEHSICFTTVARAAKDGTAPVAAAGGKAAAGVGGGMYTSGAVTAPAGAWEDDEDDTVAPLPTASDLICSDCNALPAAQRALVLCSVGTVARSCLHRNLLPRAIRELVESRKAVKTAVKAVTDEITKRGGAATEDEMQRLARLDVQQKALKLTANSIYGCLGFTASRFYARDIAKLVTYQGRAALMSTVAVVPTVSDGLEVIYGDTDSVMINTGVPNTGGVSDVLARAADIKKAVNSRYRLLEIEMDALFRSLLLVRKKKYAAITCLNPYAAPLAALMDPSNYKQEVKGLDMVRRDWCPLTARVCRAVLDTVLKTADSETVLDTVGEFLKDIAARVRAHGRGAGGTVKDEAKAVGYGGNTASGMDLREFVITKSVTRSPLAYKDPDALPHVAVALRMMKGGEKVAVNDFIHYLICLPRTAGGDDDVGDDGKKAAPTAAAASKKLSERAFSLDEVKRDAALVVDAEWYLACQLVQPVSKLLEHLPDGGTPFVVGALGLSNSKHIKGMGGGYHGAGGGYGGTSGVATEGVSIVAARAHMLDAGKFEGVERVIVACGGGGGARSKGCGAANDVTYTLAEGLLAAVRARILAGPDATADPDYNPMRGADERLEAVRRQFGAPRGKGTYAFTRDGGRPRLFQCRTCGQPLAIAAAVNTASRIARRAVSAYLRTFSSAAGGLSTHGLAGLNEGEVAAVAAAYSERSLRSQLAYLHTPFYVRSAIAFVKATIDNERQQLAGARVLGAGAQPVEGGVHTVVVPALMELEQYIGDVLNADFDRGELEIVRTRDACPLRTARKSFFMVSCLAWYVSACISILSVRHTPNHLLVLHPRCGGRGGARVARSRSVIQLCYDGGSRRPTIPPPQIARAHSDISRRVNHIERMRVDTGALFRSLGAAPPAPHAVVVA